MKRKYEHVKWVSLIPIVLIIFSLACNVPALFQGAGTNTPGAPGEAPQSELETESAVDKPTAQPTPTSQPLPPAVIETDPIPGGALPQGEPVRITFNQPMDQDSVADSLRVSDTANPRMEWQDNRTLLVFADQTTGQSLTINLDDQLMAANGISMLAPVEISYQAPTALQLTNGLPEDGTTDADPTGGIMASFNQPVVPLGMDPVEGPQALIINPAPQGHGEWVSTSTYVFYPDPPLNGGQEYNVEVNPELAGISGGALESSYRWSFTTNPPRLEEISVYQDQQAVPLDSAVTLEFNQPMDSASAAANFSLLGPNGSTIPGDTQWADDFRTMVFTPTNLLARDQDYTISVLGSMRSLGGTALGSDSRLAFHTVPDLRVSFFDPSFGATFTPGYNQFLIYFNGPIQQQDVLEYIDIEPEPAQLNTWWRPDQFNSLQISGRFDPNTEYTVEVSTNLPDPFGGTLDRDYSTSFMTGDLPPNLIVASGMSYVYVLPSNPVVPGQITNLTEVPISVGEVSFNDFTRLVAGDLYLFEYRNSNVETWSQPVETAWNQNEIAGLSLSRDGSPVSTGLYYLYAESNLVEFNPSPVIVVASNYNITMKVSGTQVFVWVVDLRTNEPAGGEMINIVRADGVPIASGTTRPDGVFSADFDREKDSYSPVIAIIGQPGDENFAVGTSMWMMGISSYDFGIESTYELFDTLNYIYTDRPIYRPGDTVYYRVISRGVDNSRYSLPETTTQTITIFDSAFQEFLSTELDLSVFGTAHGEFVIPDSAAPGYFRIESDTGAVYLQVAEYRKPEIDLQVSLEPSMAITGTTLTAEVSARYFFDAPAGDVPVRWTLYAEPFYINLPGYQTGEQVHYWMEPPWMRYTGTFGYYITDGRGRTNPDGTFTVELPVDEYRNSNCRMPCQYMLEVVIEDESELLVSARDQATVHGTDFYIGVKPDLWVGQAGDVIGYDIKLVDLQGDPTGDKALRAEFSQVEWVRREPESEFEYPTFTPIYTIISSSDFRAGEDGLARLEFTPPSAGTYQLTVTSENATTETLLWVGGQGDPVWPAIPNQRLQLETDKDEYLPGETATIFIPSPLEGRAMALLTIERGEVMRHQIMPTGPNGFSYELPLTSDEAPNVYLAVTLIGQNEEGLPDFRQGYVNIPVAPVEFKLNIDVISDPVRVEPREEVTFMIQVTDHEGEPVEGEFSLAVIDKAVLALTDPAAGEIGEFFYGNQPLAVDTSLNLAIFAQRRLLVPGGMGGGGGDSEQFAIREDFPDTAFWQADIVTDANGVAEVSMQVPDSLTTWNINVRGVTTDSLVGQTDTEVITTKPMLVRPVTPRFFTAGDHVLLAAIVHNNTEEDLTVDVSLQATGFQFDDPGFNRQSIELPAGGRQRVEWWGTISLIDSVDLVFMAVADNGLQDASRPEVGDIPVLRYDAPQTFATSGVLREAGERMELVSIPPLVEDLSSGSLEVTLSTSLAGSLLSALDVIERQPYETTEQILSRFLPNLEMYRALNELGIEANELQARLNRTLDDSLAELASRQNIDGGWSWWISDESDPYISTYVVYGLARAEKAGVSVNQNVLQAGVNFLLANLATPELLSEPWELDRLAFSYYTLMETGETSTAGVESLFYLREDLSPWAQAMLLLTIDGLSLGEDWEQTLRSNLQSTAEVTGTGAFWVAQNNTYFNINTPVFNTAMAVYALAKTAPDTPLLPDAARYLMAHRNASGGWYSTYESAWSIMALTEFMVVSGELEGEFGFGAALNTTRIVEDRAGIESNLSPVTSSVPVSSLYPDLPNALMIEHGEGQGPLYYAAHLNVMVPVEAIEPYQRGIAIERTYHPSGEACTTEDCPTIEQGEVNQFVKVHLAVTLENDAYYLVVEDFLPAGAEVLDTSLKTSEQGVVTQGYQDPLVDGWGWWYFFDPQIYDDRVVWAVDYLPAGTYHLTYTLVLTTQGEYRVIPASARQMYFPEVQGNSAGDTFVVGQ